MFESQFFPIMWVSGMELRCSELAEVPLTAEPSHQLLIVSF